MAVLLASPSLMAAPADDHGTRIRPPGRASGPTSSATIESLDRGLGEAKRRQALAPTLEHERSLAVAYLAVGILDAALDHFGAALTHDPHDAVSLDGTARIWRDWGYPGLALPHAYRAVHWSPASAGAQSTLGTVLLALGRFDAARDRFERARALEPGAAFPMNNLCYLELVRARPAEAVALCEQAVAADPESQVIRNNLTTAFAMSGELGAAVGVSGAGGSPSVGAYNQGVLWLMARNPRRAREAFGRSRIADPTFAPPIARLRQLSAGEGR